MFNLEIKTSNAAFHEAGEYAGREHLKELISTAGDQVNGGSNSGNLRDYNGNTIGSWTLDEEWDDE